MYLIAGLGNPEKRYNGTRHNVGFGVIDYLSEKYDIDLTEMKLKGMYGKGRIGDEKVIFKYDDGVREIMRFTEVVETASKYIENLGGFEKFAEWGVIRPAS